MPDGRPSKIEFPLGGVFRGGTYAQKTSPYTSPRGINVRSYGPFERRGRGGSRPGLAKVVATDFGSDIVGVSSVTYLDGDGERQTDLAVICGGVLNIVRGETVTQTTAFLVDDDDKYVTDEAGNFIIFNSTVSATNPVGDATAFSMAEKGGKLLIADSTLLKYDPVTGEVATVENAPTGQPLVCVYQERVVLAGANHLFYMSAQADDTNWDFGAEMGNVALAVAGYVGDGGKIGETILAMLPHHDRALIFGTAESLWAVYGNPAAEGRKVCVSPFVGILAPQGIVITPDGLVLFLARDGLYSWQVGSEAHPAPFSGKRIPDELLDVDPETTDILMVYDHKEGGIHLFLTPADDELGAVAGTHWWIDLEHKGLWQVSLPAMKQPLAVGVLSAAGGSNVILGCKDGYLRRFLDTATDDDGTDLQSDILIGPFHVPRTEGIDGMVTEIVGALADGSGDVSWALVVGASAEEAVDAGEAAIAGDDSGVAASGTWGEGQNAVDYPRARGPWAVLWLSSAEPWAFESVGLRSKALGRLR